MDRIGVPTEPTKLSAVNLWEGHHLPVGAVVEGTVVQQSPILALVDRIGIVPCVSDRRGHADEVYDFIVDAAHSRPRPKVAERRAQIVDGPSRDGGLQPLLLASRAGHHHQWCREVSTCFVGDDHLGAIAHVQNGRPSNANIFKTLQGLLSPKFTVVEVVAGATVVKGPRFKALGPCCTDRISRPCHAVVNGCVGLQIVLRDPNDLTLDDQFADHLVGGLRRVGAVDRRHRALRAIMGVVQSTKRGSPARFRNLGCLFQLVLLGHRRCCHAKGKGKKDKMFHRKGFGANYPLAR